MSENVRLLVKEGFKIKSGSAWTGILVTLDARVTRRELFLAIHNHALDGPRGENILNALFIVAKEVKSENGELIALLKRLFNRSFSDIFYNFLKREKEILPVSLKIYALKASKLVCVG